MYIHVCVYIIYTHMQVFSITADPARICISTIQTKTRRQASRSRKFGVCMGVCFYKLGLPFKSPFNVLLGCTYHFCQKTNGNYDANSHRIPCSGLVGFGICCRASSGHLGLCWFPSSDVDPDCSGQYRFAHRPQSSSFLGFPKGTTLGPMGKTFEFGMSLNSLQSSKTSN